MTSKKLTDFIDTEKLLQTSFDAIKDGITVLDTELTIVRTNKVTEELYSDLLPLTGKKCYKVYRGNKKPCSPCHVLTAIESGSPVSLEMPLIRDNHEPLWIEVFAYPVQDSAGKTIGVVELVRDISERHEAAMVIKQSREWYRALAEDIPVLLTRVSAEGLITYVNDVSCEILGLPREEIIGQDFFELVPSEHREFVREKLSSLTPEKPIASFVHQNRSRWFRWKNRAVYDQEGTLKEYFTVGEDITESREAEEKLLESEARNRVLVGALPDLIFRYSRDGYYIDAEVKDIRRLTEKGRLLHRSKNLVGSSLNDVLPGDLAPRVMAVIEKVCESGRLQVLEYSYPVGDEICHHEARMVPSGPDEVMAIIRDITDRKKTEEALRQSEERYRDILATIEEGYYEADLAGNITHCNEAACRVFGGYTMEEAIGINYMQLYKDHVTAFKAFNRVFTTGQPERGLIMEMIRRDGSIGYGEISISLIKDKEGRITGFKGIGKDVTERIAYEQRLEFLSLHDQLTGIYNRAYFEAELERLNKSRDYPVTIISADLDGLKLINDTLGHDTGDRLLKNCAAILQECLRQEDILARVGGDEFSAILPRTDKAAGENIVRRIRECTNRYNQDNGDLPLGISLGVATAEKSDTALKDLFKRADDMMYRDKLYRGSSSRGRIVQSLLAALAERDYLAEGHARRLEELCRAMGEKVKLTSDQLAGLALLAQVHDLGKVGVPDHILFKPGPLNEDEWEIMRSHPEKGFRIASSSPDLAGIAELILKHHENWDGGGYPLGLKEEGIPVECRILAIVDAFDAMTNKRPYNKIRTVDQAITELESKAGSQFDPGLVPVFISVLRELDGNSK
jgi:diguanylate cyclase (GGDEF)-like protein/PAS domain S-box-containing protein